MPDFVIGAYPGPPPEQTSLERYREMAELGLNVILPANGVFDEEGNRKVLDLAAETGLRVIVWDGRIAQMTTSADAEIDPAVVEDVVRSYRDHPALLGYAVRDEPSLAMFPRLAEICRIFRRADPDHEPLINLFPSYASAEQLGTHDFGLYLREYVRIVQPSVLCYDHYPLRVDRSVDTGWHRDLALVSEESRRTGIPFWIFLQSEGIRGALRVPTKGEIFWQANTALAYGARGVLWFCYWTPPAGQAAPRAEGMPPPPVEEHHDAILDAEGRRTPLYDCVKEENAFLGRMGRILSGWTHHSVARFRNGELVPGSGYSPAVEVRAENASVVVGTWVRNGLELEVLVVNDSPTETAEIGLFARTGFDSRVDGRFAARPARERAGGWDLEPGGCVLLHYYRRGP